MLPSKIAVIIEQVSAREINCLSYDELRTVPPLVTAHTFCASRDIQGSQGICPLIQQYFCMNYDYVEKADLSKGYQNPKRKFGEGTYFSEITEVKFGKKLPYILCILALFGIIVA